MHRKRLIWQLYPPYLLITLLALVIVTWYATRSLRQLYFEQTAANLHHQAVLLHDQVAEQFRQSSPGTMQSLVRRLGEATGTRITVIDPSGRVLGDTREDPARMENHADRPEVRQAARDSLGQSTRFSHTLGQDMMYVAIPVHDGGRLIGFLRTSLALDAMHAHLRAVRRDLVLAGLILAILAAVCSYFMARRISLSLQRLRRGAERFTAGELGHQLPVPDSEEIGGLAKAMNAMSNELHDRMQALVRQREETAAVLASMVEGVLAVDAEERIITINRAAGELLSVATESALGRTVQETVRNPELLELVQAALRGVQPLERDIQLFGRRELHLQAQAAELHGADGQQIGALVVLHDVTKLRRLESIRRDFVANVSHELKTPITTIKGFVETLLDGAIADPAAADRFLRIVAKQADRLEAIVKDLLSLSRLESEPERMEISASEGRLSEVVSSAVQACQSRARAREIEIAVSCPDDLMAVYNGGLLEQALVNLIDNAIKYSDPGHRVEVSGRRDGGFVEIAVRDEGCGIAPEHVPRLFERFYRVDKARSRTQGGTGLGLAIVKHIAQIHGGQVGVESTPRLGSTFTIRLPADLAPDSLQYQIRYGSPNPTPAPTQN
jgi:two-component system phosphate regulon sensor histidine kinase PhoR